MRGPVNYALIFTSSERSAKDKFPSELFSAISLKESPALREKIFYNLKLKIYFIYNLCFYSFKVPINKTKF